jgi:NAD(P)-dependent dehydrogenase (short-subunit alcohol dehydrogenase family)
MTRLKSFTAGANVAVIGASGGIGTAMCDMLAADPAVSRVFAWARSPARFDVAKVEAGSIDIEDETSVEAAAATLGETPLDIVLVLTGILHDGDSVQPERRLKDLDPAAMQKVFAVNAIGPATVAKHFLPRLRRSGKTVFAALSARVGSIGDNQLGGWASYRASKAALNQFIRTLSIEHARRYKDSVLVALHPGTVDTSLSKPFTGRTPSDRLFSAGQSADYLLTVIDNLTAADTGGFFAWDGSRIEY